MKQLESMVRRNYADLAQKVHAESWQSQLPPNGSIIKQTAKDRTYYYWQASRPNEDGKRTRFYIGPANDAAIQEQVELFQREKVAFQARRKLVRMLTATGLPHPDRRDGEIVAAMEQAGFFRLRGVLVGSLAYQTYTGLLGVHLPEGTMQTEDADFAQFHSIAVAIDDQTDDLARRLRQLDPTFREVPHHSDPRTVATLQASDGYKVELLTPNYSKDEYQDKPPRMPALGGMAAQPLRHLDFLIHQPVSAVLLHKGGIAVNVPQPERYAVHKLLVGPQRGTDTASRMKADKDITQAGNLVEAMASSHALELGEAWMETWGRGPSWRQKLQAGKAELSREHQEQLEDAVREACADYGVDAQPYIDADTYNRNQELVIEDDDEEETPGPGMAP